VEEEVAMDLRDLEEDMIEEWPVLQLDREGDTIEEWVHHQALEEGMMDLLMVATREVLLAGVMVNLVVAMKEDHLTAMWVVVVVEEEEVEEGTILKMELHLLELGMIIEQGPVKHV
jgi:hypothetical protein